jgi:hypothetical protein
MAAKSIVGMGGFPQQLSINTARVCRAVRGDDTAASMPKPQQGIAKTLMLDMRGKSIRSIIVSPLSQGLTAAT